MTFTLFRLYVSNLNVHYYKCIKLILKVTEPLMQLLNLTIKKITQDILYEYKRYIG